MQLGHDQLLRAVCDETRLRSLLLLQTEGELCVCELVQALDAPQPRISRHLAVLRETGLVADRRQGQWVYYRLAPDLPAWAVDVLTALARGAAADATVGADRRRLAEMAMRPGSGACAGAC